MKKKRTHLIPIGLLILALAACNLRSTITSAPNQNAGATSVAQTVEAVIQQATQSAVTPASPTSAPATLTPDASDTPVVSAATQAATNTPGGSSNQVCDNAQFISETIPDGTIETPGAAFIKTWRLKNTGACTWTSSYNAVFLNGDALGAASTVPLTGNVAPGQTVDISVNMTAPAAAGNYTGNWSMRNASGVLFGLGKSDGPFWIKISVVAPTATTSGLTLHLPVLQLLPVASQVLIQVSVAAAGTGHAVASCPSGSILTGGGFAGSTSLLVYSNFASGNSWEADAQNLTASAQGLNVYAECLSNSSGATQQVYAQANVPANSTGQTMVSCPSGTVVTGGGFASNLSLAVYSNSASGNGWEVAAQNKSSLDQPLNAYVLCLSGTSGTSQQVLNQVSVSGNVNGNAVAACPASTYLTGGGFAGNQSLFVYNESAAGSSWQAYAQNSSGSTQLLNAYAVCLTLP